MTKHPSNPSTPIDNVSSSSKAFLPTSPKFSFRANFISKTNKLSSLSSPTKPTASFRLQPSSSSDTQTTTANLASKVVKVPSQASSSYSLRSKPKSADQDTALGKRRNVVPDSAPPLAKQHDQPPAIVTRSKSAFLKQKPKLAGPLPPSRNGTLSNLFRPESASPASKIAKVARSDIAKDVHGPPAYPAASSPSKQTNPTASEGAPSSLPRCPTLARSNSLIPSISSKIGTLPRSRSKTPLSVFHGATDSADGVRKRTQSISEGIKTPTLARTFQSSHIQVVPCTPSPPKSTAGKQPSHLESGRSGARSQVSKSAARPMQSRRSSSVDLRTAAAEPSVVVRGKAKTRTMSTCTGKTLMPPPLTNNGVAGKDEKENGPPPSFVGPRSLVAKTLSSASTSTTRHKRSSLPMASALFSKVHGPFQSSDSPKPASADTNRTSPPEKPTTKRSRLPGLGSTPQMNSKLVKRSGSSNKQLNETNQVKPLVISKATSMSSLRPNQAGTNQPRLDLGITASVIKDNPITNPSILAIKAQAGRQPITTPEALTKARKRLSMVLGPALNIDEANKLSNGSTPATPTRFKTTRTFATPISSSSPTRAAFTSSSTTPIPSPTKSCFQFPSKPSPPDQNQDTKLATVSKQKNNSQSLRVNPQPRTMSDAEIDADLLASLKIVAQKANLRIEDVLTSGALGGVNAASDDATPTIRQQPFARLPPINDKQKEAVHPNVPNATLAAREHDASPQELPAVADVSILKSTGSWSTIADLTDADIRSPVKDATHQANSKWKEMALPRAGAITPSLSELMLTRLGKDSSADAGKDGSNPHPDYEPIGDISLDLIAMQLSPNLSLPSPDLEASVTPSTVNAVNLGHTSCLGRVSPPVPTTKVASTTTSSKAAVTTQQKNQIKIKTSLHPSLGLKPNSTTVKRSNRVEPPHDQRTASLGVELGEEDMLHTSVSSNLLTDDRYLDELNNATETLGFDKSIASQLNDNEQQRRGKTKNGGVESGRSNHKQANISPSKPLNDIETERLRAQVLEMQHMMAAKDEQLALLMDRLAEKEKAIEKQQSSPEQIPLESIENPLTRTESDRDLPLEITSKLLVQIEQQEHKAGQLAQRLYAHELDHLQQDLANLKRMAMAELEESKNQMDLALFWQAQLKMWDGSLKKQESLTS